MGVAALTSILIGASSEFQVNWEVLLFEPDISRTVDHFCNQNTSMDLVDLFDLMERKTCLITLDKTIKIVRLENSRFLKSTFCYFISV